MIEAGGVWPVDEGSGWIGQIHRRTDLALGYGLRPREAAVVRGMVLGDRSLIPEDLETSFQRSGVTHASSIFGSSPSEAEKRIFGASSIRTVLEEVRAAYGLGFREHSFPDVGE